VDSRLNAGEIAGETVATIGEATGRFPRPTDTGVGESTGKHAFLVAAGILISRIIGVIRQRVFAHYLGTSDAAGAFSAAFRIPNFLQNVFGEGALSASFIPAYANLLARGDQKEASRVADAVLTLLALATSVIVLVGVLTTPFFVGLFAYSFDPATRASTSGRRPCSSCCTSGRRSPRGRATTRWRAPARRRAASRGPWREPA
jgi:hypothetical protein